MDDGGSRLMKSSSHSSGRNTKFHTALGAALLLSMWLVANALQAQVDPGPRPRATRTATTTNPKFATFSFTRTIEPRDALGADGAGAILTGSGNLAGFWGQSIAAFANPATVTGGPDNILGLGPAFNGES